jgi:hypothetical protein
MPDHDSASPQPTRRSFLKSSSALVGSAAAANLLIGRSAHAAGSDVL